jgi:hypothetical protein
MREVGSGQFFSGGDDDDYDDYDAETNEENFEADVNDSEKDT